MWAWVRTHQNTKCRRCRRRPGPDVRVCAGGRDHASACQRRRVGPGRAVAPPAPLPPPHPSRSSRSGTSPFVAGDGVVAMEHDGAPAMAHSLGREPSPALPATFAALAAGGGGGDGSRPMARSVAREGATTRGVSILVWSPPVALPPCARAQAPARAVAKFGEHQPNVVGLRFA